MKDGGPAFPIPIADGPIDGCLRSSGMSLRDYFAARAMGALFSNVNCSGETLLKLIPSTATVSYAIADAMIAERNKC